MDDDKPSEEAFEVATKTMKTFIRESAKADLSDDEWMAAFQLFNYATPKAIKKKGWK